MLNLGRTPGELEVVAGARERKSDHTPAGASGIGGKGRSWATGEPD